MTAQPRRWGLVMIDLQRDLCYDERRAALVNSAIPHIRALIDAFTERELPVYFTKFELPEDDPQFERFGDRYCIEGSEGAQFIDEILPLKGVVVPKTKHSAFFETDLDKLLRESGCDGVVLGGLQTQICILTSAADAYHRGFEVVVASDCAISTREEVRLEALEWIEKYVGAVRTSTEVIDQL